jgi:hypothetical protein
MIGRQIDDFCGYQIGDVYWSNLLSYFGTRLGYGSTFGALRGVPLMRLTALIRLLASIVDWI